ncbi:MAG: hypothetical protein L6461_14745 [Anaerolineae bacterium]|nr:hypothetical protein [Anaerolineae bacterium]
MPDQRTPAPFWRSAQFTRHSSDLFASSPGEVGWGKNLVGSWTGFWEPAADLPSHFVASTTLIGIWLLRLAEAAKGSTLQGVHVNTNRF